MTDRRAEIEKAIAELVAYSDSIKKKAKKDPVLKQAYEAAGMRIALYQAELMRLPDPPPV